MRHWLSRRCCALECMHLIKRIQGDVTARRWCHWRFCDYMTCLLPHSLLSLFAYARSIHLSKLPHMLLIVRSTLSLIGQSSTMNTSRLLSWCDEAVVQSHLQGFERNDHNWGGYVNMDKGFKHLESASRPMQVLNCITRRRRKAFGCSFVYSIDAAKQSIVNPHFT